jgi:hypothetical protein
MTKIKFWQGDKLKKLLSRWEVVAIIFVGLLLGVGIYFLHPNLIRTSPLGGPPPQTGVISDWKLSDRDNTPNQNPLRNEITDSQPVQTPKYDPNGALLLTRDGSGAVKPLLRFQGEVRYSR